MHVLELVQDEEEDIVWETAYPVVGLVLLKLVL